MKLTPLIPLLLVCILPLKITAQSTQFSITLIGETAICSCEGGIFVNFFNHTPPVDVEIYAFGGSLIASFPNVTDDPAHLGDYCPGTYKVVATDASGQTAESVIWIEGIGTGSPVGSNPLTVTTSTTPAPCYGSSNGTATASVTGGAAPYTYIWASGSAGATITGLGAGTYTVTVTDINGCTATSSATIEAACPPEAYITQFVSPQQFGTGLSAYSSFTPPVSFSWGTSSSSQQLFVNASGTYTVTITDNSNCTATASYTYIDTGTPFLFGQEYPVTCNGPGGIQVYYVEVVPGTISVDGPAPAIINPANGPNSVFISVTQPGTYQVGAIRIDSVPVYQTFVVPQFGSFTSLPLLSSNPAYCNLPTSGTSSTCEKVCPNTTFTYSIGDFNSCSAPPDGFSWNVTGAANYSVSPDEREVVVTWGASGSGLLEVEGDSSVGCFSGSRCITIIEEPLADFTTSPAATNGFLSVCKGQNVKFTNKSINADLFEWTFPDDLSNTYEANPSHTFKQPGTFTVTLIARSLCFCADTLTLNVEVLDAPTPIVDCVNSICPGEEVTYSTDADCGNYNWTVSPNGVITDGGGPADDSITVHWLNGVEGIIGLVATSCSGSVCPANSTVRVPILSDQAQIRGRERVCPNEEAEYSIESFDGAGYVWTTSTGGTIVEGQGRSKIVVRWGSSGAPQWVAVEYENCYLGCIGRDTHQVLIRPPFAIKGTIEGCAGDALNLKAEQVPGNGAVVSNWTLYGPNGSIANTLNSNNLYNYTFPSTAPGKYRLLATPIGAGLSQTCSDSAEKTLQIVPLPPKPTGIAGPKEFCAGRPLTYQASGTSPLYNVWWTVNAGSNYIYGDQGNPINVTFSGTAPHWVAARQVTTDNLNCLSDSVRLLVVPIQPFTITGMTDLCEGTEGTYTVPNHPGVDFSWQIQPATAGVVKKGENTHEIEVFWAKPGLHYVTVNICGQVATYPVNVLANPEPTITAPAGLCPGKNGVSVSDGVYNAYQWKNANGQTIGSDQAITTGAGNFALVVTDNYGCRGTAEMTIEAWPGPNLHISTSDPTGFCANSESVTIDAVIDEDFEYTYEWFHDGNPLPETGPSLTTNQYGSYTCQVTNQYGCTASDGPIVVFEYCGAGGVCHNPGHPSTCPPGTVGFVATPTMYCDSFNFQFFPSPDYVPNSLVWHFGESGSNYLGSATDLQTGFKFPNVGHYIVVTYAQLTNGATCVVLDSVKVEAVANFSFQPECPGAPTAFKDESTFLPSATLVNWHWDFNDYAQANIDESTVRNPNWNYQNSGFYNAKLTVTAASGCLSEAVKQVKVPVLPTIAFLPQWPDCANNATPMAVAPNSTFTQVQWKFGDPASGPLDSIDGFSVVHKYATAGIYTATATATNVDGCKSSAPLTVPIVPNNLTGNITPANPTFCEGSSTILTAPSAPVGSSYVWSNGMITKDITIVQEGTYTVTITDPDGCTYVPPITKAEMLPTPDGTIEALLYDDLDQLVGTQPLGLEICFGENVHLQVQDNGDYSYSWSNSAFVNDDELLFTEDRGNLLSPGTYTYTVTITGSNGCSLVPQPYPVIVHELPSGFSVSTNQACAGTPATLSYAGPQPPEWQVVWNTGDVGPTLSTEVAGHYFVRVVNQFGCKAESNKVTIHPGPNIGAIPGGCHTRCNPDTLCITPMPDIVSWQWYHQGTPIAGATTSELVATQDGTYYAVVEDLNGCTAQSGDLNLTLLTGYGNISGSVWSDVNNNGQIDATDTLIHNIPVLLWQNGAQVGNQTVAPNGEFSFQNILSTQYSVSVDTANLDNRWEIVIGADPTTLSGCDDEERAGLLLRLIPCAIAPTNLAFSVCPGQSYLYNGFPIVAGSTQVFTYPGAQTGCDSVVNVSVTAFPVPSSNLPVQICPSDTYTYQGAVLSVGQTQQFTLTNPATGCDSLVNVSVTALPVASSNLPVQICPSDTYTYQGTVLSVGQNQQFTLTNPATGCDSLVNVSVTALPVATSNLAVNICQDDVFNYQGITLAPGQSQQFTLTNPATGCDSLVNVTVNGLALPVTDLVADICPGTTYDYNGQALAPGTYEFHYLTQPEQCDSTVFVTVNQWPDFSFDTQTSISCADAPTGVAELQFQSGTAPLQWTWANGIQNDTVENLAPGTYTVTVSDNNGCTRTTTFTIGERPPLTLDAPATATLPCDNPLVLLAPALSTGSGNWVWNTGATTSSISVSTIGTYTVRVSNECEQLEKTIEVSWADAAGNYDFVYVPNAFEPNGIDAENSLFRAFVSQNVEVISYKMEVFDRWGDLVFRSLQPETGWDAIVRQKNSDTAVFTWYMEIKFIYCGQETVVRKKGDVTAVR